MPEEQTEWISPQEAARRVSERVGFIVTPDDLKQLRRLGKITRVFEATSQVKMYDAAEIATLEPPKKREPLRITWEEFLKGEQEKRKRKFKKRADQEAA